MKKFNPSKCDSDPREHCSPACSPPLSLASPPSSPALGLRHHDRTDQVLVKILKIFNGMGWLQVVEQGAGRWKSGCAISRQADCCPHGTRGREEVEKLKNKTRQLEDVSV